jgi:hypothetical protein
MHWEKWNKSIPVRNRACCLVEIDCQKMLNWVFSHCPQPWHVLQVFFCSGWDWCEVLRSQYSSHLCCFVQGPVLIRLSSQSTSCVSPCAWNLCITCISGCLHFCYSQKSKWVWSATWIPHQFLQQISGSDQLLCAFFTSFLWRLGKS